MLGFLHMPQLHFINLVFLLLAVTSNSSLEIAKQNCSDRCGNLSIPFPFGTTQDCYHSSHFSITCNKTFNPPKAFLGNGALEITDISLDGQLKILEFIAQDCYAQNNTRVSHNEPWIQLAISFTVNNTANKYTVVGCDTYGFVYKKRLGREYETGCTAWCATKDDLERGSCTGLGCCQTSIPKQVRGVNLTVKSYYNYSDVWDFNKCGYGFVVEESAFKFSPDNLTNLKNVDRLPLVLDWAIGNETCEDAKMNISSYACKSVNSTCYKPNNGYGYRCSCIEGYEGNAYLVGGCQDIDECKDPKLNTCEKNSCVNTPGSFNCSCPKGYHGDGIKKGRGCILTESPVPNDSHVFKLLAGISLGVVILVLSICLLYVELKRRRQKNTRRKFFFQNGGIELQQKLSRRHGSSRSTTIYSAPELENATNNFHNSMIIGQGGFGIVYKGVLHDNSIVAIKKSKKVDPNQIDQFTNEVIVLSQINHRNVVKLLGCCLETETPLLVYEFISNGTLFEHINNKAKSRLLSWDTRLRIATETAGVLSYLHSAASTPIIHRDVKSGNILLDHSLTAKVSDFGASRLVPLDQTQLSTIVQGTLGYLDPEYMQTNQLTVKSDVYSFGVLLVELLTGMKAWSCDRPVEERNLAHFFLYVMRENRILQVVEDNVAREGNKEVIMRVAVLAKRCLKVKGEERPFMKEVAMELEGLRTGETKHSWIHAQDIREDEESLLGVGFINSGQSSTGTGTSTSGAGFDSLENTILLGGGR